MQVSVEKLDNPLEHKLTIGIPPDWIDSEVDKQVHEYAKNAKLPGFRPGKIPFKVMIQRYGPALSSQIVQDKIPHWVKDAFEAKELKVAGFTSLDFDLHTRGSEYEFSVTIEVLPEIPDSAYENLPVVVSESEIKEEHIQNSLTKIAVEHAEYVEIEVSSDRNQRITLQYRLDQLTDEDFSPEMFYFTGRSPNMKQFDKALEGVRSGDRIEFEFDPNSFLTGAAPSDELKRNLSILIHKVEKFKEEPQVDDALAEKLEVKGGLEELKKQVAAELERSMKEKLEDLNSISIEKALYERNETSREITIPRCMYLNNGSGFGAYPVLDEKNIPNLSETEIEVRKKNNLFQLVIDHIFGKYYESEMDKKQFEEFVLERAQGYEHPDQFVRFTLGNEITFQRMHMAFRQKKAIEKIMETAKSTTEYVSTYESGP
ncbi:MAG: hypothetical protein F4X92_01960 [Gammaproteobacteria bacterium]|nr:hypothetical protein [Gammaproteobacteria bacterium]